MRNTKSTFEVTTNNGQVSVEVLVSEFYSNNGYPLDTSSNEESEIVADIEKQLHGQEILSYSNNGLAGFFC